MIDAFCITIDGHETSERGYHKLVKSSKNVGNDFSINHFPAVTPKNVKECLEESGLKWNWPNAGSIYDEETKIKKVAYATRYPEKRIACALSHYCLWQYSVANNKPILIFEHDALFLEKLDVQPLLDSRYGVIGLNDPRGATRLPNVFHRIVSESKEEILPVPTIDRMEIAQGIAGASAYLIKPWAAKEIVDAAHKYGLWPNDALICQQLFDFIGVTKKYYTKVQGLPSTTSL